MTEVLNIDRISIGSKLKTAKTYYDITIIVQNLTDEVLHDLKETLERASDYLDITLRDEAIMSIVHTEVGDRAESKKD